MKIESIIRREGGTQLTIGDTAYDFQPDADGRHVAEVSDEAHVERLLSISEGFRAIGQGAEKKAAKVAEAPAVQPQTEVEPVAPVAPVAPAEVGSVPGEPATTKRAGGRKRAAPVAPAEAPAAPV